MRTRTNGILAILLIVACVIGMIALNGENPLDFRGTVTSMERDGETVILTVEHFDSTVTVRADDETKVRPCCEADPAVTLAEIEVGDRIEGNLKDDTDVAKIITVYYE